MSKSSNAIARLIDHAAPRAEVPLSSALTSPVQLVAECIDARHPVLAGRVQVRWEEAHGSVERWLPTLRGVAVRERDRVLVLQASNELDPIVVGVLDGFEPREVERRAGPNLELACDEVFTLRAENGKPLLEIIRQPEGPVVRLLTQDIQLELPGKLRIQASDIELSARHGSVRIQADDDVVVQGEMVRLN